MRFFMLAVLRAQYTQVPFLANNITLDREEYHPCQNGAGFSPVPKGQGSQMRFIVHPHPRGTSGSSNYRASAALTRASTPSSVAPDAAAAPSTASADATIAAYIFAAAVY